MQDQIWSDGEGPLFLKTGTSDSMKLALILKKATFFGVSLVAHVYI